MMVTLYKSVLKQIPVIRPKGGDFAVSSAKSIFDKELIPQKWKDKRMLALLSGLTENLKQLTLDELVSLFQMTIKARLPSEDLVNGLMDEILIRLEGQSQIAREDGKLAIKRSEAEQLSIKHLAQLSWAVGKLKVPEKHGLPNSLKNRAWNMINEAVQHPQMLDWSNDRQDPAYLKSLSISSHGLNQIEETLPEKVDADRLVHL